MKVNMFFMSNTGNTEVMADALKEACEAKGIEIAVYQEDPGADKLLDGDYLFLGTPAVGTEEYDKTIIGPAIDAVGDFKGMKVLTFGSYGWGDGEYMKDFKELLEDKGAKVVLNYTVEDYPEDDALEELKKLVDKL